MNDGSKVAVKVLLIALCGALFGLMLAYAFPLVPKGNRPSMGIYYPINMMLSMSSIFVLSALLRAYVKDYREIRARFTLGLIIFLTALLFQAIFTLPLVHAIFGFSSASLGPFSMITNLLELVAMSVFLYLSET